MFYLTKTNVSGCDVFKLLSLTSIDLFSCDILYWAINGVHNLNKKKTRPIWIMAIAMTWCDLFHNQGTSSRKIKPPSGLLERHPLYLCSSCWYIQYLMISPSLIVSCYMYIQFVKGICVIWFISLRSHCEQEIINSFQLKKFKFIQWLEVWG